MYQSKLIKTGMAGAAIAASMLLWAPIAGAATVDGTVGPTSTGTVDVSIYVGDLVQVSNLDPIQLNYVPSAGDVTVTEPFCVWATAGTEYGITISSANPVSTGTAFVAVGATDTVGYSVDFAANTAGTDWLAVSSGVTLDNGLVGFVADGGVPTNCSGGDNAALRVTAVEVGNLNLAPADTYSDELTLLVEPI